MSNEDYQKLIIRLAMEEFGGTEDNDGQVIIKTGYTLENGELKKT